MSRHLLSRCHQSLFALRTLRQHGLPADALQVVYQAVIINKLSFASPAWWSFDSTDDQNRLKAFLRPSTKLGYRDNSALPSPASVTRPIRKTLLRGHIDATFYIHFYYHGATDITRMTLNFLMAYQNLKIKNFLMRMLYRQCGCNASLYIS